MKDKRIMVAQEKEIQHSLDCLALADPQGFLMGIRKAFLVDPETFGQNFIGSFQHVEITDEMREWCSDVVDSLQEDSDIEVMNSVAGLLYELREFALSLTILQELVQRGNVDSQTSLGITQYLLEDYETAKSSLQQSVDAKLYSWEAASGVLAEIFYEQDGRTDDEVVALLTDAIKEYPGSLIPLAAIMRKRQDVRNAKRYYEQAIASGLIFEVAVSLGNLYWDELDDIDMAEQVYRQGYEVGDTCAAFNLSLLLLDEFEDRYDEAIELMRFAAAGGDDKAVAKLVELGE
ncbi:MAG: hypothetical protein WBA28_08755 [Microbacteriaceae bacterium]